MAKKVRDLNPARHKLPYRVTSRYSEFLNLLLNAVKIVEKGSGAPLPFIIETFAKRTLFERGAVGYDKLTKKFYYVFGVGIGEYAQPTQLNLLTANGQHQFTRKASYDDNEDGAYIIYGLPVPNITMGAIIAETTDFMANCDVAMRQNLEACKTPYIVVCQNDELRLSFEQAVQEKLLGQAAMVVTPELGDGLKAVNIATNYLVDKFAEARDKERDTLLNKLGILTSNLNKRERVQSAEVNATLGQATDYIYLLIDTFNKQMATYGIPYEMQFNGSLEEIYLNENEIDVNDVEERNKVNAD